MIKMIKGLATGGERVRMIPEENIGRNPFRPRRAGDDPGMETLKDSIRRHGLLTPLTVRPDGKGRYMLIAGERRLRAVRELGIGEAPCIVLPADDRLCAEFALIESMQRRELDMFEQAQAIENLIRIAGLTREEASRQLSCSPGCVSNKLRLLRMSGPEREIVRSAGLSERHARAALRLADPEARIEALRAMAEKGMSVVEAEDHVENSIASIVASDRTEKPVRARSAGDLTPLVNTIERSVGALNRAGVDATVERVDSPGATVFRITVPTERR